MNKQDGNNYFLVGDRFVILDVVEMGQKARKFFETFFVDTNIEVRVNSLNKNLYRIVEGKPTPIDLPKDLRLVQVKGQWFCGTLQEALALVQSAISI